MPPAEIARGPNTPGQGTYGGLFYESERVALGRSGWVTLTITTRGRFTGSLLLGKERYSGQGQFYSERAPMTSLWRHGNKLLVVTLRLSPTDSESLVGWVSSEQWTAQILTDRAPFNARTNPAPYAGSYTLVIPASETNAPGPAGSGCGVIRVDRGGRVSFTGTMADGTPVAQRAMLSRGGDWPLFGSLYHGTGAVLGWIGFGNQTSHDIHGALSWIQPPSPRSKPYPGTADSSGFEAFGCRYAPPKGANESLQLTNAAAVFAGPTPLGTPFTHTIRLRSDPGQVNRVCNSHQLRLSLKLSSGAFSGTVMLPGSSTWVPFKGVLLQQQHTGAGFFLCNGQSGLVSLGAAKQE